MLFAQLHMARLLSTDVKQMLALLFASSQMGGTLNRSSTNVCRAPPLGKSALCKLLLLLKTCWALLWHGFEHLKASG